MKRISVILLLVAFVFQSTSSLWIMASFYFQRAYIAQNLCINRFDTLPLCKGKCYVANILKDKHQKEHNLPSLKQKEIQFFTNAPISFEFISSTFLESELYATNDLLLSSQFISSIFHPPKTTLNTV